MTLRFFSGFDDNNGEPGITLGSAALSPTARTGTGSLSVASSVSSISVTSAATMFAGAAFRWGTLPAAAGSFLQFREVAAVHCYVGLDATGHIVILGPAGTVVATSAVTVSLSVWYYVEAKAVIADAGGTVDVKLDGVSVVTFTGDTRNGATGVVDNIALRTPAGTTLIDDMYILDSAGSSPYNTYLGDIVVRTLLPDGNGASSDMTGSDGNSTDNYLLVDEPNASSTDYVGTSATAKTDLYTVGNIPTTDLPLAIQPMFFAGKSDGGTPPILKLISRGDGGTVVEESASTLSTTYQFFGGVIRTTDPDGDTLTATNVNGLQVGARTS